MKQFIYVSTLIAWLIIPVLFVSGNTVQYGPDRSAIYAAMAGKNLEEINTIISELQKSNLTGKEAYEGALLMKKAGLLSKPKEKLKTFKSGREKLEAAIRNEPDNVEYRFLRLMIQENAPKVVKYRDNIQGDGDFIKANYKEMAAEAQKALVDYSKVSKVLTPSDF